MKRWIVVTIACLAFTSLLVLLVLREASYVPYVPVRMTMVSGDVALADAPELATPGFLRAVQTILERYEEAHRWEGDVLLIPPSLAKDRDLVWNYTTKADQLLHGNERWVIYDGRYPRFSRTIAVLEEVVVGTKYPWPRMDAEPDIFVVTDPGLVEQVRAIASSHWGQSLAPPFEPPGTAIAISRVSDTAELHEERYFTADQARPPEYLDTIEQIVFRNEHSVTELPSSVRLPPSVAKQLRLDREAEEPRSGD